MTTALSENAASIELTPPGDRDLWATTLCDDPLVIYCKQWSLASTSEPDGHVRLHGVVSHLRDRHVV